MKIYILVLIPIFTSSFLVVGLDSQNTDPVPSQGIPYAADSTTDDRQMDITATNNDFSRSRDDDQDYDEDWVDINMDEVLFQDNSDEQNAQMGLKNVISESTSDNLVDSKEKHKLSPETSGSSVINTRHQKMVALPAKSHHLEQRSDSRSSEPEQNDEHLTKLSSLSKSERARVLNSLEASFLNIVGLKSRPKPDKSVTIPQYMLDLYNQHLDSHEGRVRSKRYKSLHKSNTIRSFYHQEDEHGSSANVVRLKFNISSLPGHEVLRAAELRLFCEGSTDHNQQHPSASLSNSLRNDSQSKNNPNLAEILKQKHRIDVYQIMLPSRGAISREAVTRLLDTRIVNPTRTSWETFDITPALESWRSNSKNYGLEIRVSKATGEPSSEHRVRLRRSTTSSSSEQQKSDRKPTSKNPLLVTYSDDPKASSGTTGKDKREKRDAKNNRKKRNPKKDRKKRKDRQRKDRDYRKNCRRRSLYVDFHDVGWTDWIVAPPGYDAYYCYGDCPFPLAEHFNTTNHAVVQQFVHSVDPQAVPKPCCVPTELSEVALLYIDEQQNVVLKRYEEMVVEACGCR